MTNKSRIEISTYEQMNSEVEKLKQKLEAVITENGRDDINYSVVIAALFLIRQHLIEDAHKNFGCDGTMKLFDGISEYINAKMSGSRTSSLS